MATSIPAPKFKIKDTGRIGNLTTPGQDLQIRVTGLNVAIDHWAAFEALVPGYILTAQNRFGELMVAQARLALSGGIPGIERAYLTGKTHDSVYYGLTPTGNGINTSTGPTTFYAPFIEFGLASHSGKGPRPFMAHALADSLPWLIQAYADLAAVAKHGSKARISSPPYKKDLESYLRRWRVRLYSLERALGNVAVLAPLGLRFPGSGKFRTMILHMAREIGDLQAIMHRTVGLRFQRRLVGKVTGRLIGVGSRTVFVNQSVGARITGAQRLYNVEAGKLVTKYIDQSNSFLGR